MKLHHFAVVSQSPEHAERFYEGILELEQTKTATIPMDLAKGIFDIASECQMIRYSGRDVVVEVFVFPDAVKQHPTFEHVCLAVDDKEGFIEKCRQEGCDVKTMPKGDAFVTFIKDFDGNLFEVKETNG